MRGVRKNRYREATRTLQSGVPDNLRGCWSGLYPYASRSKYQSICNSPHHSAPPSDTLSDLGPAQHTETELC